MDSSQKYVYKHHWPPEFGRWVGTRSSAAGAPASPADVPAGGPPAAGARPAPPLRSPPSLRLLPFMLHTYFLFHTFSPWRGGWHPPTSSLHTRAQSLFCQPLPVGEGGAFGVDVVFRCCQVWTAAGNGPSCVSFTFWACPHSTFFTWLPSRVVTWPLLSSSVKKLNDRTCSFYTPSSVGER